MVRRRRQCWNWRKHRVEQRCDRNRPQVLASGWCRVRIGESSVGGRFACQPESGSGKPPNRPEKLRRVVTTIWISAVAQQRQMTPKAESNGGNGKVVAQGAEVGTRAFGASAGRYQRTRH